MDNKKSTHNTNWLAALFDKLLHEKFPQRCFTDNDLTKLMKKYIVGKHERVYGGRK